jgi:hypothetical protein
MPQLSSVGCAGRRMDATSMGNPLPWRQTSPPRTMPTILLVDDSEEALLIGRAIFERSDYAVVCATDGQAHSS